MAFGAAVIILLIGCWSITLQAQKLCGRAGGLGPCPPGFKREAPKQVERMVLFRKRFTEPYLARRNKAARAYLLLKRQLLGDEE